MVPPAPPSAARVADPPVLLEPLPVVPDLLGWAARPEARCPMLLSVRGWQVCLADPVGAVTSLDALNRLGRVCRWRAARHVAAPPFAGGAAGYLSDDCSFPLLDLGSDARPAVAALPPLWLGLYDAGVCVAPGGDQAWLVAADLPGHSREPAEVRLARLRGQIAGFAPGRVRSPADGGRRRSARLSLPADAHAAAVARAREWIAAGDLYQLNLTFQLAVPWPDGGAALARRLWAASPRAAHAAYLRVPGARTPVEVVSVSPETFLRTDGDAVVTRPIKGTRPRRADPAGDRRQAAALRASAKDRAEHVMIVDLERNDLGRVCAPSTVRVPELARLEAHPTVWHLASTVTGRLRAGVGLGDLLAATFPSGSVTGAPKRMAVARTAALEPVRRGVYCGAVGVVSRGLVDFSVAIRTAVVADGVASYGAGGGIVADSDAAAEFREALDKARAFLTATRADPPPG